MSRLPVTNRLPRTVLRMMGSTSPARVVTSANLAISGDIDMMALIQTNVVSGSVIAARWLNGFGLQSFFWSFNAATFTMRLDTSSTGANTITASATQTTPLIAQGMPVWVRVTRDVDNGAGGNDTNFYYAPANNGQEPTSWIQIGSTVTNVGTTSIFTTAVQQLDMGAFFNGNFGMWLINFYRYILKNGIDGDVRVDANFGNLDVGTTSFTDRVGNTIDIGGGTTVLVSRVPQSGRVAATGRVTP